MPFNVILEGDSADELRELRVFEQRRITDEIASELTREPTKTSRNRKKLDGLSPSFEHVPPIWELRVGEYRVFYDVNTEQQSVHVRAVRHKGRGQTTENIV